MVWASRGRYCAGRSRYVPDVPVRAGPGRLVPEPAVMCLSLPEPLKDRKKRCSTLFTFFERLF